MKPIRLDMNYFGPFERESIDFNSIKNSMFLISGKTGSGKTMIFDAITYALYGTLSTSDRMEGSVRSQFATEADISSVRLNFEIRGRQYTVERTLSYQKEGRKTPVPPKAVIYDEDGGVLEGSINGVKNKVLEIIKLDADQFRQILILPQGEFKRLLVSSSESKQEILRTLFRTERFVHFEIRLNELKKEKLKDVELVESRIEELFNTLSANGDSEIEALINEEYPTFNKRIETIDEIQDRLNARKKELNDELEKQKKEARQLSEAIQAKERHNQQVERLAQTKNDLDLHEGSEPEILKREENIKKYKQIRSIEYELRSEQELINQKDSLNARITGLKQNYKNIEAEGAELQKALDKLDEYKEKYRKNQKWLSATERFIEDSRYADLHNTLASKEAGKKNLDLEIDTLASRLEEIKKEDCSIEWNHEAGEKLRNQKSAAEAECNKIRELMDKENKNIEYDEKKNAHQNEKDDLNKRIANIDETVRQKRASISSRYSSEDKVHIEHLVAHLAEGDACPVCQQTVATLPGSQEYLTEEDEAAFKNLEAEKQKLQDRLNETERNLGIIDGILESMERHDLNDLEKMLKAAEEQRTEINRQIEDSNSRYSKKKQFEEQMKELESSINEKKLQSSTLSNSVEQLKALKADFETQTEFKNQADFRREFHTRRDKVKRYEKQQQDREQQKQHHAEQKSRLEENMKSSEMQLENIESQLSGVTPVIDQFIKDNGSKDRHALLAVIKNTDIEGDEQQVKNYYTQKDILKSRITDLEAVLESAEAAPVEDEKEKLAQMESEVDRKTNDKARLEAQVQHNENIKEKITDFTSKYESELDEINELVELVNAVSGKNEQKVSLERFVLTYYLDRILYIANLRLLEMTNHRYELRRSTGRSNRKTGLDIEVFDFYNNHARHISSLSGGETFQASLTLALALNEALQQESGGISLDTMLIDEGFGTLDPETLDMAISTLIELQTSGKMVGIISHVEELKERMENILEVKAVNERSTADFR
ncbi:SbcC/MukB-like Walker B domain-containing protein [Salinicoccus sp. HZC-1]|uniref:SbcC/MukB-like Walker B domain-containing protein n=1 Tax=Salinicoccus sp. HZC-1 TaxID=3385497 RepID=UPI00398ADF87